MADFTDRFSLLGSMGSGVENTEDTDKDSSTSYPLDAKEIAMSMLAQPKSKMQRVGDVLTAIAQIGMGAQMGVGINKEANATGLSLISKEKEQEANRREKEQAMALKMLATKEALPPSIQREFELNNQQRVASGLKPYKSIEEYKQQTNPRNDMVSVMREDKFGRIHFRNVDRLDKDQVLKTMQQVGNRLYVATENVDKMIANKLPITYNDVNELYQAVSASGSLGNQTTGAERQARVLSNYENLLNKIKNYMQKNKLESIPYDHAWLKQALNQSGVTMEAIKEIGNIRIDTLSKGTNNFYKKVSPEYKQDFEDTVQANRDAFNYGGKAKLQELKSTEKEYKYNPKTGKLEEL